jgi:DNA processing protein
MAHGLHMVSPASNKKLSERIIASGGALISEFPLGKKAEAHRFVRRDRTQAALSQGVVMVQSDLRGGSLHAPRAALYYKRWVAIPYPTLKDRKSKAFKILANLLIADGEAKDKMNLLGCNLEALSLIIILNSRDDYPLLLSAQIRNKPNNYPFQEPLI